MIFTIVIIILSFFASNILAQAVTLQKCHDARSLSENQSITIPVELSSSKKSLAFK
jgi:hypothetical protein